MAASCAFGLGRGQRNHRRRQRLHGKDHGPDRVFGFSPIPAMSMVSYAAGSRYLSLLGGVCMSFYDWYCDLPPASPMTWGEQTDVPESADWYNAGFLMLWGSNVPQTRTPDAHFYDRGALQRHQEVVICPTIPKRPSSPICGFGEAGHGRRAGDGDGPCHPDGVPSSPAGAVFRGLLPPLHRHADAGAAGEKDGACARPLAARQPTSPMASGRRTIPNGRPSRSTMKPLASLVVPTGSAGFAGASRANGIWRRRTAGADVKLHGDIDGWNDEVR
jgi:hypothetical protein